MNNYRMHQNFHLQLCPLEHGGFLKHNNEERNIR